MPKRMTPEDFVHRVELLYNKEYDVLENYITANIKIKIKHCTCGRVFLTRPADFLQGRRCPFCYKSKGEDAVQKYLQDHLISFKKEKKFIDCIDQKPLRFDFYLPDYNACIEYDGLQHYTLINYFGGEERFKDRQKKDKIKNNYCSKNNIFLLRIRPEENMIEKIENFLSQIRLQKKKDNEYEKV